MSEDNPETPPEAPLPETPSEPTFTQADIDAAAAKARAQGKRQAKKELEQQMAQTQSKETPTETGQVDIAAQIQAAVEAATGPLVAQLNEVTSKAQQAEFTGAIAGLEISDQRKAELSALYAHSRELFDSAVASERAKDAPPQPKGPGYSGLGAPNPLPDAERLQQPHKWTRDDIATMKANGTFLENVKKYSAGLPGSGGGLFPAKTPGKK